jgi:hypothetical protein
LRYSLGVVDTELETSGAPLDQVERRLGLELTGSSTAVAGDDITTVEKGNSHVLSVARVAHNHLVVGLEACSRSAKSCNPYDWKKLTLEGKVADLEALMGALLSGDDGRVTDEGVVDTRVWHQVGLELVQIDVESSVETQTGGDGANNLSNQAVEMLIVGTRDVQAATADIIDSFVVNEEGAVGVLDGAVGRENGVVGLDDGGRDAGSGIHGELELALLAVVGRETLEEERTEARSCTATERVEDEETLERGAVV